MYITGDFDDDDDDWKQNVNKIEQEMSKLGLVEDRQHEY